MKIIFLVIFSILSIVASAKKEERNIQLKSVRGEYSLVLNVSDVTGREAVHLAREQTKRNAIEKACGVKVNIWEQIETSSVGDVLNSLSINQIDGEIVEFNIVEEGCHPSPSRPSEMVFYCIADVVVKKGGTPDPNFTVLVSGIRAMYYSGELLQFEVRPHQDCFMNIFLLENETTGYLLYPNSYDKSRMFRAEETFKIADAPNYEFMLQKNKNLKKEINRLAFVFTKEERRFDANITSRKEIERWMAAIPNDQKYIHFSVIEIRDK